MIIKKWVTFEQEVDVEVDSEDIQTILAESPENEEIVLRIISRFHSFMKHTNQDIIDKINDKNKAIIRNFLIELALAGYSKEDIEKIIEQ